MLPLWIFSEGDQKRGLGHLSRCYAYAAAWRLQGGEVHWVVDGDETAQKFLSTEKITWRKWNKDKLLNLAVHAVALVDSYCAPSTTLQKISSSFLHTVYLDDTFRTQYPKGLVIHAASCASLEDTGDTHWLTGQRWQPLRPEFWDKKERNIIHNHIQNVLIIMGGTDTSNLTKTVYEITREEFPLAMIHVVTNNRKIDAPACKNYSQLNALEIASLMNTCDIAISAAGQTMFELIACTLPSIIIKTANNQSYQMQSMEENDLFELIENWTNNDIKEKITMKIQKLKCVETRMRYIHNMRSTRTMNGAIEMAEIFSKSERLRTHIEYHGIKYSPLFLLNEDEKLSILSIRNMVEIRNSMFHTNIISTKEHFDFIKRQANDICCINYAAIHEGKIFGSVSLEKIDWQLKECRLDIYKDPDSRWRGFGVRLLSFIKMIAFNVLEFEKITLAVKMDNTKAIASYRKSGFLDEEINNPRDGIVNMYLKRDN